MADLLVTSADGTRIAVGQSGSGPPLVLVHGTSGDRWSFRFVEPLLADRFTVYAMDRRGRGASGDSTGRYAIEDEFADVAAVVDSLAEPADLLGHSYGATVALGAAPAARNLRRLVLYEPSPGIAVVPPEILARIDDLLARDERDELLRFFLEFVGFSAEDLARLEASPLWGPRVDAAHTIVRELHAEERHEVDPVSAGVTAPTLLLLGGDSPAWARDSTEAVRQTLPDSRVVVLEGQGHVAIMTAPELVTEEVVRFLIGVDGRPALPRV